MTVPADKLCEVIPVAQDALARLTQVSETIRRLRAALHECETCPDQDCETIIQLSESITTAINELSTEWGLV